MHPRTSLALVLALCTLVASSAAEAAICGCNALQYNSCASQYPCSNVSCTYLCLQGTCGGCTEPEPPECVVSSAKAAGTACASDGNPCTTDECDGIHNCTHPNPTGGSVCGTQCIAPGTCCNSPNSCAGVTNGTGVCPAPGGTCTITCNAGYKVCGNGCIANTQCCTNSECPDDPAGHRRGVCNGTPPDGCGYACDFGYRLCNGACIPTGSCCASTDCQDPPNACYQATGTCTAGACTYAYANGAPCNADGTKCTPNDSCVDGSCVADTAHQVVCITKDCNNPPTCRPDTGNCVYNPVANGTGCGGNGCTPAGTCAAGVCSTAPQTTDCSGLDTDCRVGLCDPDKPGTGTEKCGTANVPNDTPCALTDKCLTGPACSGGECVGTRKACAPSGECRAAACNPTTGDCEETVADVGTACALSGGCLQNTACDATGSCVGDAVPDGSPCELAGCTAPACVAGQCVCYETPDLGTSPAPDDLAGGDLGGGDGEEGCAVARGAGPVRGAASWAMLLVLLWMYRRKVAR